VIFFNFWEVDVVSYLFVPFVMGEGEEMGINNANMEEIVNGNENGRRERGRG
jgi:hypothetical protein